MDIKTKIKEFLERGSNLINASDYEQWFKEIHIFSKRYLQKHPLQK
ncbi:hypothetical protein ACG0Z4_05430 [Enterocloster aldenensis]